MSKWWNGQGSLSRVVVNEERNKAREQVVGKEYSREMVEYMRRPWGRNTLSTLRGEQ